MRNKDASLAFASSKRSASLRCQRDAIMGINGRMEVIMREVQLHGIIIYTECLKVAMTTPEEGLCGHLHIRRSLLTDNPPRLL